MNPRCQIPVYVLTCLWCSVVKSGMQLGILMQAHIDSNSATMAHVFALYPALARDANLETTAFYIGHPPCAGNNGMRER